MMYEKSYIVSGGKQVEYTSFEKMIGGINSEVYKVKKGGKDAVLKFYSKNASNIDKKGKLDSINLWRKKVVTGHQS